MLAVLGMALATTSYGQTAVSNEDRSLTTALIADAQTRTGCDSNGVTGHDSSGFFLSGNDGFRMNIGGDFQFRYTYNNSDDADAEYGFNIPLTRLRFNGTIHNSLDFMIEPGFNDDSGDVDLYNAFIGWQAMDNGRLQFGQFQLPFLREDSTPDRFQLAADKSIMSYIFGQGYSQGVQFAYDAGDFRMIGAFSDGFNSANTDYTDPAEADYSLTARAEYLVAGSRSDFSDFTAQQNQQNSLLLGGAVNYQDSDLQSNVFSYTGDVSWENSGWNAYLAGVGRNMDDLGESFNDYGVELQGGYRVTEQIEPFVRYDAIFADSARNLANDDMNFLTAGVNYYLYGHAAKFTADAVWSLDDTSGLSSLGDFSHTGVLGSPEDNEITLRLQFQVLF